MTRKAKWIGPDRSLRLTGQPARLIKAGDEFEIPTGETLGGEGRLWKSAAKSKSKTPAKSDQTDPATSEE